MANVLTVANAAELKSALSTASGGDTILLKAGNYGKVSIGNSFSSEVTIKSASATSMATITELRVDGASNVTFEEIKFDYSYSKGDSNAATPFLVTNSNNLLFSNSIFDGDVASGTGTSADGAGFGKGFVVRNSTSVAIIDNEFTTWWKAVGISDSANIQFSGNDVHSIRSDGLTIGTVKTLLIDNNHIHDFGAAVGSGDHRDMIQIQRGNGGSTDVIIRDNVLDMGRGDLTQGIWAGLDNTNASNSANWHKNVLIQNNVIYNAQANGIALSLVDGLKILDNTVLAVDANVSGGVAIPKINVSGGSKSVTIQDNVVSTVIGFSGQSDWNVSNNAFVQNKNPSAAGYYGDEFIVQATAAKDGYNSFGVKAGGIVDRLNAGSDLDLQISSGSSGGGSSTPTPTPTPTPPVPSTPPVVTQPPTDTTTDNDDDDDSSAPPAPSKPPVVTQPPTDTTDDNDDDDDTSAPTKPKPVDPVDDDDVVTDSKGSGGGSRPDRNGGDHQKADNKSDFFLKFAKFLKNGGQHDDARSSDSISKKKVNSDDFKVSFNKDKSDGGFAKKFATSNDSDHSLRSDNQKSKASANDRKFDKAFSIESLMNKTQEQKKVSVVVDHKSDRLKVSFDDDDGHQQRKVVLDDADKSDLGRSISDVWANHGSDSDGGFQFHQFASYVENAHHDDDGHFF